VEAGKLRLLLTGMKTSIFPNVPTLRELGYPRDFLSGWHAVFAPAGIPESAKKALVPALEKAINHPATRNKIEAMGYVVDYRGPEGLRALIKEDFETAKGIAEKLGLGK
jgi:tripartite-type tricarboxylate transporter receptor subunit TctC